MKWAKRAVWAYFWLLIFEGALRKWALPQFSAPVALVRDPVVLFIYWQAFRSRRIQLSEFGGLGIVALCLLLISEIQLFLARNDVVTTVFGLRSYLLHLPLIFIMKDLFTGEDVKKIGRYLLLLSIPMTVLLIAQFYAPSDARINTGAVEGSGQISFTDQHVRASGTFSFVTGIAEFYPLVQAFLIWGMSQSRQYSKVLLTTAAIASLIAIPMSGSRTLLFFTGTVVMAAIIAAFRNPVQMARLGKVALLITAVGIFSLQLPSFRESLVAFQKRWDEAAYVTGSNAGVAEIMNSRVLSSVLEPFEKASDLPLVGYGIGLGSNFAATRKTGSASFLLSEGEWLRVCQECGPIVGLLFMAFRVFLCARLVYWGFRSLNSSNLGILVAAATIPQLLFNVMQQPTNLGFMAFGAGLSFAASRATWQRTPYQSYSPPIALTSVAF